MFAHIYEVRKKRNLRKYNKKLRGMNHRSRSLLQFVSTLEEFNCAASSQLIYPDHTREILIRAIRVVDNYRALELDYIDCKETAGGNPDI